MSVIEFHIWPEDNPVGEANKLAVITDEDVVVGEQGPAIWYEPALHGLGGRAGFSINRHSELATSEIIREDNFVRVKVPEIGSGYLKFGWWMRSGEFHLIDSDEEGGENITIEGPGLLHKLATGSLYHSSTVDDQPARGSADRDGLWWWIDEPYGAMLTRAFEEGRHSPYPDPAEAGSPLEFFDIDFSRTHDSASVAWPNIDAEFQVDIGTDLMTLADKLRESGNLYIVGDASDVDSLQVHCYQTYGSDKSGAFGAGTVRFEKAVNIATELVRRSESGQRINKLLLRNSDGDYSTETLPGFSAGDVEHWGFWDANQTNDDTLLNAIGLNVLRASQTSVEPVGFEAAPGKSPTTGLYLPDLHYKVGDTVTVHTGTDDEDYDEADQLVVGFRVSIREGARDDTSSNAQRSLRIEPQLNYYAPRYGNSNIGAGPMTAGTRIPFCEPAKDCESLLLAEMTAVTATNGDAENASGTEWSGGVYTTAHRQAGARAYGSLSGISPLVTYTFDPSQVFSAGVRYVIDVWTDYQNDHDVTIITFGDPGVDTESRTYQGTVGSDPPDIWDEYATGADGQTWTRGRVCWTPTADRTGVTVDIDLNSHGPAGYIVVDSLKLYTADNDNLNGTSGRVSRCDHGHSIVSIPGLRDELDALAAGGSYTDEQAQDAVGGMIADTATVNLTYTDATPELKADVLPAGIKLDDLGTPDDNTDLDATTSEHGLLKKLGGGTVNFLRADGTWSAPPGGGGSAGPYDIQRRTAGDLTVTTAVVGSAIPSLGNLQLAATAGDFLLVGIDYSSNGDVDAMRMDVATIVSAAVVNYLSTLSGSTSTLGIAGWGSQSNTGVDFRVGHVLPYIVQSGDLSSGSITLSLRAWMASGSRVVFASGTFALTFWAKNLGA